MEIELDPARSLAPPRLQTRARSRFSDPPPPPAHPAPPRPLPDQPDLQLMSDVREEIYWGRMKPYCVDPLTQTPRFVIAPSLPKALLLNLLIIGVLCLAVPIATNHRMFGHLQLPPARLLHLLPEGAQSSTQEPLEVSASSPLTPRLVVKRYSIYVLSGVWTLYQLGFLGALLVGNPGYGREGEGQVSLEEQREVKGRTGRSLVGLSRCKICSTLVDNSVYHCEECDLCCEGFSHHCEWIGKCVGYRNSLLLQAYFYGFPLGIAALIALLLFQSLP